MNTKIALSVEKKKPDSYSSKNLTTLLKQEFIEFIETLLSTCLDLCPSLSRFHGFNP